MENKEKQIEETAKNKAMLILDMPNTCSECLFLDDNGDYPFCTVTGERRGYNFRTRELKMVKCPLKECPEDNIVLSRKEYEEYQKFKSFMERNDWESIEDIETTLDKYQETLYERLQQECKETAEKILNEIDCVPTNEVNELNHLRLLKNNIAKQFGIEIKE